MFVESNLVTQRYPIRGIHGRVVQGIGRRILSGDLPPGEFLPRETELVDQFQVSRTVIREAIRVLAAKGLVVAKQRAGTRVRSRTDWNLLDPDVLAWMSGARDQPAVTNELLELRGLIEPIAARYAAERASEQERREISERYEEMHDRIHDTDAFFAADLAFHHTIFVACHNEFIARLGNVFATAMEVSTEMFRAFSESTTGENCAAHGVVADAILARDGDAAEAAMRTVNELGRKALFREVATQPH